MSALEEAPLHSVWSQNHTALKGKPRDFHNGKMTKKLGIHHQQHWAKGATMGFHPLNIDYILQCEAPKI